jgi:two-component sensor histidine kinase
LLEEGSDGVRRFYTFRKLRLAPDRPPYLFLVLGIPETIALDQSRQILKRNLLLMGLVVLGTLLLAWSIGRYAYQPLLSRINHTANGIKSGNLSVRTGVARENTELERIAKTLDLMALSLEERERERAGHESALQSSLAEKETLLREIHHRVKNNLQLITSMINLQKNEVASVGDFAARLESRVRSMASVHEILYSATVAPVVDLAIHIERIAKQFETAGKGAAAIRYSAVTLPVPIDLAIPFGLILNELLTNACKYAAPGGIPSVTIDLQKNGTLARLTVSDTGPGLPEGFDPARSGGLGMQLVTHLSDQIDGQVHWSSKTGGPDGPGSSGTVCTVEFPVPADTVTPPV